MFITISKETKMNRLPDDVINRIYKFKHQLEFRISLRTIERFKYRTFEQSNVYYNCVSPIKELLQFHIITKKVYICLKKYDYDDEDECYFRMSFNYMAEVADKLDITIRPVYECMTDTYPVAPNIKYNKSTLKKSSFFN